MNLNLFTSNLSLMYLYVNIITYIIPLTLIYLYINESSTTISNLFKNNSRNFFLQITATLFFLNLAGLPPLPGFFIKLNLFFLFLKKTNLMLTILLVVFNFIVFFFYIKNYKNYSFFKPKLTKSLNYGQNILMSLLFTYVIFFPIFCWYIYILAWSIFL